MKANAIAVFMVLTVVPSIVKTEMCTCPPAPDSGACLKAALQAKLTSTPTYIQQLQNVFYFSNNVQSVSISTNMTVNVTCESAEVDLQCKPPIHNFSWTHHWYENTFVGVVRKLITARRFPLDPVAYYLTLGLSFSSSFDFSPYASSASHHVQRFHLNCSCVGVVYNLEKEMANIWEDILQWVSNSVI